jgi:hypothetical protein
MQTTQEKIKGISDCLASWDAELQWLRKHGTTVEAIHANYHLITVGWLQFADCNREDTVKLLTTFPGKWSKSASSKDMYYTLYLDPPLYDTIRQIQVKGTPPPSCRIVEELIDIPARQEMRQRIVCDHGELDAAE